MHGSWLFAAFSAFAGGTTETLVNTPSGVIGTIIIVGAVVGAVAMIWAKAIRPCVRFGRKVAQAVDLLLDLPDWQEDVECRMDTLEGKAPSTDAARSGNA